MIDTEDVEVLLNTFLWTKERSQIYGIQTWRKDYVIDIYRCGELVRVDLQKHNKPEKDGEEKQRW